MKQTFTPGSRYVKDSRVLHIKAVKTNGVLTSRGFMTYDEINTWSKQDKPEKPISPVSAKLTKAEKDEMYRHFPSAAAAIRFAIEAKGGRQDSQAEIERLKAEHARMLNVIRVMQEATANEPTWINTNRVLSDILKDCTHA